MARRRLLKNKEKSGPDLDYLDSVHYAIYCTDESLYNTVTQWTNAGKPTFNGIAFSDGTHRSVIALNDIPSMTYKCTFTDTIFSKYSSSSTNVYNGYEKTNTIVSNSSIVPAVIYAAYNYKFPNGSHGYLPGLGEIKVFYNYYSYIMNLLTGVGGSKASDSWRFSCDRATNSRYWCWNITKSLYSTDGGGAHSLRPFGILTGTY